MSDPSHEDDPSPPAPGPRPFLPVLGYATPGFGVEGKTVVVARCGNSGEAEILANELDAAGIPAQVIDHNTEVLGPYAGGADVKVVVMEADAARAAEVLRHGTSVELEPADDSIDAPPPLDEHGQPLRLEVAARFESPRLLREAATVLASARVQAFLPTLVPRGDRSPGAGKRFLLRVREDEVERARRVLREAEEEAGDEEEARCPACRSWRVHKTGGGMLSGLARLLGGRGVEAGFECLACGHRGTVEEFRKGSHHGGHGSHGEEEEGGGVGM